MLRRVALVRTDVSEERRTLHASVTNYPTIFVTLMMETIRSSEMLLLTSATRRNIIKDGILYSHRREDLKSHRELTGLAL
jgi:hypothetical protein